MFLIISSKQSKRHDPNNKKSKQITNITQETKTPKQPTKTKTNTNTTKNKKDTRFRVRWGGQPSKRKIIIKEANHKGKTKKNKKEALGELGPFGYHLTLNLPNPSLKKKLACLAHLQLYQTHNKRTTKILKPESPQNPTKPHKHHMTDHPKPNMQQNTSTKNTLLHVETHSAIFGNSSVFYKLQPFLCKSCALLKTL